MSFRLRHIFGKQNDGKYYAGFDVATMRSIMVDDVSAASIQSASDAAGITMAFIDRGVVVAAEKTGETTDEQCKSYADFLARGCWQNPSEETKQLVQQTIRENADAPMHDQPPAEELPYHNAGYMSVWEWLLRAWVAAAGNNAVKDTTEKQEE